MRSREGAMFEPAAGPAEGPAAPAPAGMTSTDSPGGKEKGISCVLVFGWCMRTRRAVAWHQERGANWGGGEPREVRMAGAPFFRMDATFTESSTRSLSASLRRNESGGREKADVAAERRSPTVSPGVSSTRRCCVGAEFWPADCGRRKKREKHFKHRRARKRRLAMREAHSRVLHDCSYAESWQYAMPCTAREGCELGAHHQGEIDPGHRGPAADCER